MATVNRHESRRDRESLLEMFRGTASGTSAQSATQSKDKKSQSEWKEQEAKRKKNIEELNAPLEALLPCGELWDALSNSLRKY